MRLPKALAAAALAMTAAPFDTGRFAKDVPAIVPSVGGWERISGNVRFENPRIAVRYEFYVNPLRLAIYELVRYRVTELGPAGSGRPVTREKLQWDRDGRDLRRFECVAQGESGVCAWQEMAKGGVDYVGEVGLLLRIYAAHNRK